MRQVKCSECGVVNRVEAHSFRAAPICGRCGTRLPEPLLNPVLRGTWRGKYWSLLGIAVVLAVLGALDIHPGLQPLVALISSPVQQPDSRVAAILAELSRHEHDPEPEPSPQPALPQAALVVPYVPGYQPSALPLPPTGAGRAYIRARADHWIDVRIKEGPFANTLVRVYRASDNALVAERFIRSGGQLKIQVPAGVFIVRSASGRDWYGNDRYFGDDTAFSEAQAQFDMQRDGAYYDLRLIPEVGGNLDSKSISRDKF